MLDVYRAVFRTPGTASFCVAAWVMRLPIAMYPIGLVLIVSARDGRYGFAGVLSGVYVIANGAGNPALARLSDRLGQRRLLVPTSLVHVAATVTAAAAVTARWPDGVLVAATAVCGFAFLSVGSLVRARWSYVLAGRPEVHTAYSLESTLDETIFVLGPLVATLVATQVEPVLVLYLGAAFVLAGAVWLASLRDSEPPAKRVGGQRTAVLERGMPLLTLVTVAMGGIFASAEVTIVAFCGQHGSRGLSGAVLAAFAAGSATAGFLYGARRWHAPLLDRFRLQAVVLGVLPPVFLLATNVGVLAACAYVVGAGIAPTLTTAFGLVEQLVPAAALTEGLAWLVTGLSVGYGAGASLVGGVADAHGARWAFLVTVGAGLAMTALAVALHARLRPGGRVAGVGHATDAAAASQPAAVGGRCDD
ncbi:Predicted arabinose efflux permease, MFS family [Jatrophihabitans endophyticus]|uniref:Predicted arabinose efflux permease, MFS family n=1 Tax=Jatrophihabitans endophyticus TaxID=1206085 RepID=A0A1M5KH24_9ACTN|nr:MFS transporter [Jatrophihabitans endophyticus]SHG51473.1 Predicted arabinose efflux permease, MFS family [Jatrophihabitans endophyticus]